MDKQIEYKIAKPITYEQLQLIIPQYEPFPLYWDNECYLFYWNVWRKIYYMSPLGQGNLSNKKTILYDTKLEPQYIIEKREYCKYIGGHSLYTKYHCPNCDENLEPYAYDCKNIFFIGKQRQHFCSKCGYPILWY